MEWLSFGVRLGDEGVAIADHAKALNERRYYYYYYYYLFYLFMYYYCYYYYFYYNCVPSVANIPRVKNNS